MHLGEREWWLLGSYINSLSGISCVILWCHRVQFPVLNLVSKVQLMNFTHEKTGEKYWQFHKLTQRQNKDLHKLFKDHFGQYCFIRSDITNSDTQMYYFGQEVSHNGILQKGRTKQVHGQKKHFLCPQKQCQHACKFQFCKLLTCLCSW